MKSKPYYDINEVIRLINTYQFDRTKRVIHWLDNHGFYVETQIVKVFNAIPNSGIYIKTITLKENSTKKADVYLVEYEQYSWYVKFYLDKDEKQLFVQVLSCHWEGCL